MNEVWRNVLGNAGTLDRRLPGDANFPGGEVAQPAVHHFGRPAARTEGKVLRFDERYVETASGSIEGYADAGHTSANNKEINDMSGSELVAFPASPSSAQHAHTFAWADRL